MGNAENKPTEKQVYEYKPAHGYFPGTVRETDIVSTIDACIAFQHILLLEVRDCKKS